MTPGQRVAKRGYDIPGWLGVGQSPGGEMLSYFLGHPVPRKGITYSEASLATNIAKQISLGMFTSFAGLRHGFKGFLTEYLRNYCRLVESIFMTCERVPLYKKEYYANASKGVWDLTETFVMEIGIKGTVLPQSGHEVTIAFRLGHIFATIVEFDDAYKTPLIDIFSEFKKEEIIKSPRKFINKALDLFVVRSDNEDMRQKFKKFALVVKLILLLPKYRRAFKKAFEKVDLKLLQWDDSEYYWALPRRGYDSKGLSFEKRISRFHKILDEYNEGEGIAKQKLCAICLSEENLVPHYDDSGILSDILCVKCDALMSKFEDNWLVRANQYLTKKNAI